VSSLAILTKTKGKDSIPVSLSVPVNRPVVADLARGGAIFCSALTKKGRDQLERLSRVLQSRSGVRDGGAGILQQSRAVQWFYLGRQYDSGASASAWDSNNAE